MYYSSRSKVKDQAMTVTEFWMSPDADLVMSDVAGQQPKRASVAKNAIFDRPDRAYVKLFDQAAREWSVPLLSPPVRSSDILIQAYHSMINEGVPVAQALGTARDAYNKLLDEIPAEQIPKF